MTDDTHKALADEMREWCDINVNAIGVGEEHAIFEWADRVEALGRQNPSTSQEAVGGEQERDDDTPSHPWTSYRIEYLLRKIESARDL